MLAPPKSENDHGDIPPPSSRSCNSALAVTFVRAPTVPPVPLLMFLKSLRVAPTFAPIPTGPRANVTPPWRTL